jgi:hypothetical protein
MKRTLLLILLALLILLLGFFGLRKYTKSFSPESSAAYDKNGLKIEVAYSRPAKKERYIFGREEDKALLPYGKVWRTGANEATVITFDQDVTFAGKPVAAGKYSLWTIPGPGSWQVILNAETGQWGTNYNDGKDILNATIPIRISQATQELFKIYFEDQTQGVNMILSWDHTEAIISIRPR